ncbi:histone-like nucleoid-structuring protein, MvaT/MvaU family [Pseudomonas sp. MHK4]
MSKLAEFRQLEKHLAEQLQALEALKGDAGLKKEIEFETKLRALLAKYGYSLKDIINLLDPQAGRRRAPAAEPKTGRRKPRQLKVYKNPHTGEVVETKGGNHKTLKEWKAEHGSATVESWLSK